MSVTDDWRRAASCEGKYPFDRYALAARIATRMAGSTNPYRCRDCGAWHVGQKKTLRPDRKRRRIRR